MIHVSTCHRPIFPRPTFHWFITHISASACIIFHRLNESCPYEYHFRESANHYCASQRFTYQWIDKPVTDSSVNHNVNSWWIINQQVICCHVRNLWINDSLMLKHMYHLQIYQQTVESFLTSLYFMFMFVTCHEFICNLWGWHRLISHRIDGSCSRLSASHIPMHG